jgi:hypothetical protein
MGRRHMCMHMAMVAGVEGKFIWEKYTAEGGFAVPGASLQGL